MTKESHLDQKHYYLKIVNDIYFTFETNII